MAGSLSRPKKGNGKDPAAAADEVQSFSGELPKPKVVKELSSELATLASSMASIRGQIGSSIKNAEADHNIHRGALREALKQFKMDPQKREEYQRHVQHYVTALGIGYQSDLFKDAAPAADKPSSSRAKKKPDPETSTAGEGFAGSPLPGLN